MRGYKLIGELLNTLIREGIEETSMNIKIALVISVILAILKLTNHIDISWLYIFLPVLFVLGLSITLVLLLLFVPLFIGLFSYIIVKFVRREN